MSDLTPQTATDYMTEDYFIVRNHIFLLIEMHIFKLRSDEAVNLNYVYNFF